ncbi:DUF4247 domain-containing protein [Bacillaceae bacterium S4-13-58]
MKKVLFTVGFLALLLLSACSTVNSGYQTIYDGEVASYVQSKYPLYDVVSSTVDSSNYSEIYSAEGRSLDEVASEIEGVKTPVQVSEENENRKALVYNDMFVILSQDEENSSNTLIEVANKEFVRNNFNPSFFQGMLLMTILDDVLDVDDWGKNRKISCNSNPERCYGGYSTSGGSFKGYKNTPSVRGTTVRGGGPGAGK